MAHPNLSDTINKVIDEQEHKNGIYLRAMMPGAIITVRTANTVYTITRLDDGHFMVSGNAKYCPKPTKFNIVGSTWGGSMLKIKYIGEGMHIEMVYMEGPNCGETLLTSPVKGFEWVHLGRKEI